MHAPGGLYISVLVPLPLDQPEYTYILDKSMDLDSDKLVGRLCFVPLGRGKTYTGVITAVLGTSAPSTKIIHYKRVLALLPYPALPVHILRLWRWVAEYYMCSLGDVYRAAVPAPFRPDGDQKYQVSNMEQLENDEVHCFSEAHPTFSLKELRREFPDEYSSILRQLMEQDAIELVNEPHLYRQREIMGWSIDPSFLSSREEQEQVLGQLQRSTKTKELVEEIIRGDRAVESPVSLRELSEVLNTSSYTINKLRDLGVITEQVRETSILSKDRESPNPQDTEIDFQRKSILLYHRPFSHIEERIPIAYLKKQVEATQGQYLLLLPSQEVLEIFEERFRNTFGDWYRPFHSGCSLGVRHQTWHNALSGVSGIYVGLRAAVWLPVTNIREVVVVDEEDVGYRQYEPSPRFTASSVALMLAKFCGARTILTSASPSIQSMLYAIQGKYGLTQKPAVQDSPELTAVDMNKAFGQNKVQARMLSYEMTRAITTVLHERRQVLLLYQRKGFAKYVECTSCHTVLTCPLCHTTYRYYSGRSHNLVCPVCGHYEAVPNHCPQCNKQTLQTVGTGVERLAIALRNLYPGVSVGLWDGQNKPNAQIIICTLYNPPLELLHHAGMIGIVQLDLLLMRPDFRANERAYQHLMTCMTEARKAKHIIIQYFVQRPIALDAITKRDYKVLLDNELHERHIVGFPPFSRELDVVLQSDSRHDAFRYGETIAQQINQHLPQLKLFGPSPLPSYKKETDIGYRLTLLIPLQQNLSEVRALLYKLRKDILAQHRGSTLFIYFDMDPQ